MDDEVTKLLAAADQLEQASHDIHADKWEKIDNGELVRESRRDQLYIEAYESTANTLMVQSLQLRSRAIEILEQQHSQ